MPPVFAYIVHHEGMPDDSAAELFAAAQQMGAGHSPVAVVTGYGPGLDSACESLRSLYSEVWKIAHQALAYPNAELVRQALVDVLPKPSLVLVPHGHFGVDLSPGLSIRMDAAYVSDVVDIARDADGLKVVRQEFGGQVCTHVWCDVSGGAVLNVRPGAFKSAPAGAGSGTVVDKPPAGAAMSSGRRYVETIAAEKGGVDITKQPVLVSVGRGIQDPENLPLAESLAEALGGAVSCSRPVVDAKWLEKSRQVGSSGQTVRPKVYLACGISGSFQHLAGIKGNPLLIAINKNPRAPIFQVADVGVVDDIIEFLPELTEKVLEARSH